jgi:2,4-dienoyl-CoA reductase-like NADH-dependent reductase (Old Yellow Enzyme family)
VFRPALPKDVALVAAGSVWTRDDAAMLLDRGADLVCVGRAAILDPDWPAHVLREGREPVRPPATAEQLAAVDVGPAFLDYLRGFRGLVTP